jgi:hypothetical protein
MEHTERGLSSRAQPPLSPLEEALSADALPNATDEVEGEWTTLFDGTNLSKWQAGVYGDSSELELSTDGAIIPQGVPLSGITYLGEPPAGSYQLEVQATRVYGADFFLGITFPVRDEHLTLVLGGWGGGLCGLSCIDGADASENATRTYRDFPNGKRQTVLIEVTAERVRAFANGERLVDTSIVGKQLGLRAEVTPSKPLGVASFATRTVLHSVKVAPATKSLTRGPDATLSPDGTL